MLRTALWCVCLAAAASQALAATAEADARCEKIGVAADASPGFVPPLGAVVVGAGRARLYSAPDAGCDSGKFLIPNDHVTVYTPYRQWMQVMFIHPKTGEDTTAWILESRIKTTGTMGPR